jgi:tetratricopeptide (TPR) repeat protein
VGLRLAAAVWRFWWLRGYLAQGRAWLERLLSLAHPAPRAEVRSKKMYALGVLAFRQGDYAAARSNFEQQLSISTDLRDESGLAMTLRSLGRMALDRGDFAEARARLAESLAIEQKLGSGQGYAWSLGYPGLLEHFEGNNATALPLLEESLLILKQLDDHFGIAVLLYYLGRVARDQQDHELAREYLAQSLGLCSAQRLIWPIPYLLEAFADLAVARAQAERGVVLARAAARLHEIIGAPLPPVWQHDLRRRLEPARRALEDPTYAAAWGMGQSMPLELAISYTLDSALAAL